MDNDMCIEKIELSIRAYNSLKRAKIDYVSQLESLTIKQLSKIRNIGKKTVREILDVIDILRTQGIGTLRAQAEEIERSQKIVPTRTVFRWKDGHLYEDLPIAVLGLSSRSLNGLKYTGHNYVSEIAQYSKHQLFMIRNLGSGSVEEIQRTLSAISVTVPVDDNSTMIFQEPCKQLEETLTELQEISVLEYADTIRNERYKQILLMRLKGLTLEEIGNSIEPPVTRERVRQILKRVLIPAGYRHIREDKYIAIFAKYYFSKEEFTSLFEEDELVYNYLTLLTKRGSLPLSELIDDEIVPYDIRQTVKKLLYERNIIGGIEIDGEIVHRSRPAIVDYILRKYFSDVSSMTDFIQFSNTFLSERGLDDDSLIINGMSYVNYLFYNKNVLWKLGRKFRYYDSEAYDYNDFWDELNFEQYNNVEYSAYKFFRDHPDLMQRYDIRDEYELHNLLRKLYPGEKAGSLDFGKMPVLKFGTVNREKQLTDLLAGLSPISRKDFAQAYENKYGVIARTVMAIRTLDKYYNKDLGIYDITKPQNKNAVIDHSELDAELLCKIKKLADECFSNGATVIFFDGFFEAHEDWLVNGGILSVNTLIDVFKELYPDLLFKLNSYFGNTQDTVPAVMESEILRIWGNNALLSYKQIAERLPYISLTRIKNFFAPNNNFIWNDTGVFTHISRVSISNEAQEKIREAALRECEMHGYASFLKLPISEVFANNHELTRNAIYGSVYRICLLDDFDWRARSKIVTRKGEKFDTRTISLNQLNIDSLSMG